MVGILEIQQFLEFLETFPGNFCVVCHCFKFFKAPKYSHYKGVCTSRDCMLGCCLWVLLGQLYIEASVDRGLTRQFYHSSYRIIILLQSWKSSLRHQHDYHCIVLGRVYGECDIM